MPSRLQYRLGGMLLVLVAISAVCAAYKLGYDRGRQAAPIIPPTLDANELYKRQYDVADLVTSAADATNLIAGIRASAAQSSWDMVGGYATIDLADDQTSLAIEQTFSGHVSVVEFLSRLREDVNEKGPGEIARIIRDVRDSE